MVVAVVVVEVATVVVEVVPIVVGMPALGDAVEVIPSFPAGSPITCTTVSGLHVAQNGNL